MKRLRAVSLTPHVQQTETTIERLYCNASCIHMYSCYASMSGPLAPSNWLRHPEVSVTDMAKDCPYFVFTPCYEGDRDPTASHPNETHAK